MEFALLFFGLIGLVASTPFFHVPMLCIHVVVLLWIAWRRLYTQPLTSLFTIAYVGMYFSNPIAVMLDWVPLESFTTDAILYRSNVLIAVGIDLFLIAALRLRFTQASARSFHHIYIDVGRLERCKLLLVLFCGTVSVGVVVALYALGVDPFTIEKTFRSIGGGPQVSIYLAAKYGFFVLPLAVFLVGLRGFSSQFMYILPLLALHVTHFFVYRTRTLLVASMIAWVVSQVLRHSRVRISNQSKPARVSPLFRGAVLVVLPLLALTGVTLRYVRMSHSLGDFVIDENRVEYIVGNTFEGGDMGYAVFLRLAMVHFPDSERFLLGRSYYRLLFVPIPRFVWPGKPENTQRTFARALDPALGDSGTTIPAGIVGDLYINFGTGGILGMLVFGLFFGHERYRHFGDMVFLAGSGVWMFHLVRGGFTNPLMALAFMWILSYVIRYMLSPTQISMATHASHQPASISRRHGKLGRLVPRQSVY